MGDTIDNEKFNYSSAKIIKPRVLIMNPTDTDDDEMTMTMRSRIAYYRLLGYDIRVSCIPNPMKLLNNPPNLEGQNDPESQKLIEDLKWLQEGTNNNTDKPSILEINQHGINPNKGKTPEERSGNFLATLISLHTKLHEFGYFESKYRLCFGGKSKNGVDSQAKEFHKKLAQEGATKFLGESETVKVTTPHENIYLGSKEENMQNRQKIIEELEHLDLMIFSCQYNLRMLKHFKQEYRTKKQELAEIETNINLTKEGDLTTVNLGSSLVTLDELNQDTNSEVLDYARAKNPDGTYKYAVFHWLDPNTNELIESTNVALVEAFKNNIRSQNVSLKQTPNQKHSSSSNPKLGT